jgi:hypothetical protein
MCAQSTQTTAASEETAARVGDCTRMVASPHRVVSGLLRRCGCVCVRGSEPVPITAVAGVQIGARRASPAAKGSRTTVCDQITQEHFGTSKEKLTWSRSELTDGWLKWTTVPFTEGNFKLVLDKEVQNF